MLYISRHGLRLNKVKREYNDDPNPPIHHSGIQPLLDESKNIESLDYVFCSPFLRCVQTAHYLNRHDAPIFLEYGMSETMREKWFKKCGYNPLNRLHNSHDLSLHYYNVDVSYVSHMPPKFPESRRDSRRRANTFMNWFKKSEYWEKDVLLIGHGFSVKDCLNNLGIHPPFQGWNGHFPKMGHLFKVNNQGEVK